ncbi:histidine triad (HIT) family protein [Rhodococcus sp. LBL1]|nr:histidine triad (HIT) family protein [Rhodococcus sp. LBL1]MDH6682931.1 histidine triad (HIT) family protein [Rhodococcus sp. LBL2]
MISVPLNQSGIGDDAAISAKAIRIDLSRSAFHDVGRKHPPASRSKLPWAVMSDQCLFCGIVSGSIPSVRVTEDDTTYAFMDINPASDGHILVIPKRHSKDLLEIPADDLTDVTLAAQRIAKAAVTEFGADGVNLLNCCGPDAWQTVFHFHLHVVPRYVDKTRDRLVLPWEPGTPGDKDTIASLGSRISAVLDEQTAAALD